MREVEEHMKERLYTIELQDALKAGDECPFCFLERKLEQDAVEFVLGSSYMEEDIRGETDRAGFCRHHTKMMYDYGNALGNAWILKTRLQYLNQQLKGFPVAGNATPAKMSIFSRREAKKPHSVTEWIREEEGHCYLCSRVQKTYERMLDTFVYLAKREPDFAQLWKQGKGCCIHHFGDVLDACSRGMNEKERQQWFPILFSQMTSELDRVQEEIDWFIEKYDYRNADADWKNSRDAVPRTMQKIVGGYPGDPPFQSKK